MTKKAFIACAVYCLLLLGCSSARPVEDAAPPYQEIEPGQPSVIAAPGSLQENPDASIKETNLK